MAKRKKRRRNKQRIENLTETILKILRQNHSRGFNYKQLGATLGVDDPSGRNQIIKTLKKLQAKGSIQEIERGKYSITPSVNYYTGTMDLTGKGEGYVLVDDLDDDIYIKHKNLNKALHGDVVEVYVFKRRKGGRLEGEVSKILQRKRTEFVGTIQVSEKFAFVETSGYNMYTDIFIPKSKIGKAGNGDKVLVKIEGWETHSESPVGSVVKVLGKPGEHHTEIHAILAQYGLPYEFPSEVEDYANSIDTSIKDSEVKKRRDMREVLTFTIDPKDAKDLMTLFLFRSLKMVIMK